MDLVLTYEPFRSRFPGGVKEQMRGCPAEILRFPTRRSVIFEDDGLYQVRVTSPTGSRTVNAYGFELRIVLATAVQAAA